MDNKFIITIDGPPASGKTTMAGILAKEFGFTHLDSGSIFRTLTLHYMKEGIDLHNPDAVISNLSSADIFCTGEEIFLGGENVSRAIRTPEVTRNVCNISNLPPLRKFVKEIQHSLAEKGGVVCDGRKTGTEIFPNANIKFYLIADQESRAMRRFLQHKKTEPNITFEEVFADLKQREDKELKNGILLLPENPVVVDNTFMNIEETFKVMKAQIEKVMK
jgi:cytidylate kinase